MKESALRNVIKQLILELRGDQEPQPEISTVEFKVSSDKDYPGSHNPMTVAGIDEYVSNVDFVFSVDPEYVANTRYYVKRGEMGSLAGAFHGGYSHALRHGAEVDKPEFDKYLRKVERGFINKFKNGVAHLCQHKRTINDGRLVAVYSTNPEFLNGIQNTNPKVRCFEIDRQDADSFFQSGPSNQIVQRISSMRGPTEIPVYSLGTIANTLDRANDIFMGNDEGSFEEESALKSTFEQFKGKKGFYQKVFVKKLKSFGEDVTFVTDDVFREKLLKSIRENVALNDPVVLRKITDLEVKINTSSGETDAYCLMLPGMTNSEQKTITDSMPQDCKLVIVEEDAYIVGPQKEISSFFKRIYKPIANVRIASKIIENAVVPAVEPVLEDFKSKNKRIAYIARRSGYLMPIFDLNTGQFMILVNPRKQTSGWVPLTFLASKGNGQIGNPATPRQMILDLSEAEVSGINPDYSIILCYIRALLTPDSKFYQSIGNRAELDFINKIKEDGDYKQKMLGCIAFNEMDQQELDAITGNQEFQSIIVSQPEPELVAADTEEEEPVVEPEVPTTIPEPTPPPAPQQVERPQSRLRAHLRRKRGK
jgi:hypothetical protein